MVEGSVERIINTCYYINQKGGREIGKSYSSREVIRILRAEGWEHVHTVGDHYQFKHPEKPGKVTVTHPVKDIPIRTLKSISKQSGIKF